MGHLSYLVLLIPFVVVAASVAVVALVRAGRPNHPLGIRRRTLAFRIAVTIVVVSLLTAVFDNVMIALGLFTYPDALILGIRIGQAPIEDFSYPVAAGLLVPSIWVLTRGRAEAGRAEAGRAEAGRAERGEGATG